MIWSFQKSVLLIIFKRETNQRNNVDGQVRHTLNSI